jgi:hypothetical protein
VIITDEIITQLLIPVLLIHVRVACSAACLRSSGGGEVGSCAAGSGVVDSGSVCTSAMVDGAPDCTSSVISIFYEGIELPSSPLRVFSPGTPSG